MRWLLIALFPTLASASAVEFDPTRLIATQGAFCEVDSIESRPAPDTAAGKIDLYEETPEFLWNTSIVPAVLGITFGVRTQTVNATIYGNAVVTLTHPPFHGSGVTTQSYETALGGRGVSINAYTFDLPEELVTGTWTFTVTHDGRTLYSAAFEVVSPAAMPSISGACGGMPLS